jgi:phosphoenolpyruvate-protein phosphotransferase (PTS system enzyme I)
MLALHGTGIGSIAIGKALVLDSVTTEVTTHTLEESALENECKRFAKAVQRAKNGLIDLKDNLPKSSPPELSALLEAHILMLKDPLLTVETLRLIKSARINAEAALQQQAEKLFAVFDRMEDEYLRTKKQDIRQVVDRIHAELIDETKLSRVSDENLKDRILVVNDLTPADAVRFRHKKMAGFVTNLGGPISHTAILARGMRLPAVLGLHGACRMIRDNDLVVVDGNSGSILINPDKDILSQFQSKIILQQKRNRGLHSLRDLSCTTDDGVPIELNANIELPEDVDAAIAVSAKGVGLYRTEFMFMNREAPGEEEQYQAYSRVIKAIDGPVTIRTLDLGADKQVDGGRIDTSTSNPALGLRAIRLCLANPSLFIPQLKAIYRASVHGNVRIMIPMLCSISELEQVMVIIREVKNSLEQACIPFNPDIPIGGMIEVPAAAIAADVFARRLSFLSLGTNDLIQYTLAIDRVDDEVTYLYDPLHPAVLRLIRNTIEAGEQNKIPVSMCGEMAGDPIYTRLLLGLGLKEFSMDPTSLLSVKQVILSSNVTQLSEYARTALDQLDMVKLNDLLTSPELLH